MDELLRELIRKYLRMEEGLTDLTDKDIELNISLGLEVYGTKEKLVESLQQYVEGSVGA